MNDEYLSQIYIWVNDSARDYQQGLMLFSKICKNPRMYIFLAKSESTYNKDKILVEFKKILTKNKFYGTKKTKSQTQQSYEPENSLLLAKRIDISASVSQIPEKVNMDFHSQRDFVRDAPLNHDILLIRNKILEKRKKLYAERGHYHGMMHNSVTKEDRFELAKKIVEIQPEIDRYNDWLADIDRNKSISSEIKKEFMSGKDFKRLELVKNYIRRYRSMLAKAASEEKRKFAQEYLDKYQKELKTLI